MTRTLRESGTRPGLLVAALALLVVVAVLSVGVGAHGIAPAEVLRALFGGDPANPDHLVVRDVRLPRAVLAVAAGAALGVAGVLVQALSRNPLAEPGVLGVTSGAGFAITVGVSLGVAGPAGELLLSVVGALLAAALVYSVGRQSPLRLVLTGTALTFVLTGVGLGLRLLDPEVFDVYRFWSIGSLAGREQAPMALPLVAIAVGVLGALLVSRQLNAVALGETVAHTLGANVARVRFATLALITLLAGAATAVAGPILFVGLMVPHLARRAGGGSVPWLVGFGAVLGPILLLLSDMGSRVLLPTGEVPVAIVTAFVGGPVLIWAVRKYGAAPL
ncbi:iron ABC transporter permease [Amycolatopsis sp. 195334CR]|uniref:FecCD family ABC transporter permease n=1 Tax=Amycolatopsis sp. 195334CR TaxID=2814588 RepID=UPI001A8C8640|nr:iron chelate uptake ABC transporter family permease subunit [Amycolatopsis sp. 195334CR]MBN6039621.1 iron chelate uptake ABC transporter family permease subunit [Amycolatopsis sp. 195334CR]